MLTPDSNRVENVALSLADVATALAPFGIALADAQLASISRYVDLLLIWNQSVNLTAILDPVEIVSRHFGESIFAGSFISMHLGRLTDVGTGAGFPGMPLKIAFQDLSVVLLEPNRKKCAFLTEAKSALGLSGVLSGDFVCCRALGNYRRFLRWAKKALGPQGRVILWLGVDDSIMVGRTRDWYWEIPVKIPESRRRVLLVGRPAI